MRRKPSIRKAGDDQIDIYVRRLRSEFSQLGGNFAAISAEGARDIVQHILLHLETREAQRNTRAKPQVDRFQNNERSNRHRKPRHCPYHKT
jgi:hypothetical protein